MSTPMQASTKAGLRIRLAPLLLVLLFAVGLASGVVIDLSKGDARFDTTGNNSVILLDGNQTLPVQNVSDIPVESPSENVSEPVINVSLPSDNRSPEVNDTPNVSQPVPSEEPLEPETPVERLQPVDLDRTFGPDAVRKADPRALSRAAQGSPVRVIVEATDTTLVDVRTSPPEGVQPVAGQQSLALRAGGVPAQRLDDRRVVTFLDSAQLEELAARPEVSRIFLDEPMGLLTASSLELTNITEVHSQGLGGSGVRVCVVDTGLSNGVVSKTDGVDVFGRNVQQDSSNYSDDHGHGTRVSYSLTQGAPNATLLIAKALDSNGDGYASDVIAGLEYCEDQQADIVSLSIGGGSYPGYCDEDPVAQKVNELAQLGVLVVAATGNSGLDELRSPACASGALPVAASTAADELAGFSNYNDAVRLVAPGNNIQTFDHTGTPSIVSGTSMAVPFVSAAAALVIENRSLNSSELAGLLVQSGEPIEDGRFMRLDAYSALLWNQSINQTPTVSQNQTNETTQNDTVFGVLAVPTHNTPVLNASDNPLNRSDANLTVYPQGASDADGDPILYNYLWRVDGKPITFFNLPMNENITGNLNTATDISTYSNNITIVGDNITWNSSCVSGGCYNFNNSDNEYLQLDPFPQGGTHTEITISLWYYAKESGGMLFASDVNEASAAGRQYKMAHSGGALRGEFNDVDTGNQWVATTNAWTHFAWSFNGSDSSVSMYQNGNLIQKRESVGSSIGFSTRDLVIGDGFNGSMDEVKLFNYSLTAEQVFRLYEEENASKNGNAYNTSTIVSGMTAEGQVWSACVVVGDNDAYGQENCSNSLTVSNSEPTHAAPIILASDNPLNQSSANITAYNQSTYDDPGDTVINGYDWRLGGTSIARLNLPLDTNESRTGGAFVRDLSTYGKNGTLGNGSESKRPAWLASCKVGGCFDYDGSDDVIKLPADFGIFGGTANFTVAYWVNADSMPVVDDWQSADVPLSFRGENNFMMTFADGSTNPDRIGARAQLSTSGWTTLVETSRLSIDNWHYVVVSFNTGDGWRLYENGSLLDTNANTETIAAATTESSIGGINSGTDRYFDGSVDQVMVFDRTLSADQVAQLYEDENTGASTRTLVLNETKVSDVWSVCVTPSDGAADGTTRCSLDHLVVEERLPSVFNSVQHGSLVMTGTSSDAVLSTLVNTSNSFIFRQVSTDSATPTDQAISARLLNSSHVRFERDGSASTAYVTYYVVEYSQGIDVERGSYSSSSESATLDFTHLPTSFSTQYFRRGLGTEYGNDDFGRGLITDNKQITFTASNDQPGTGLYEAVDIYDATVQSGTGSITGLSASETLDAVDTSKAVVLASWSISSDTPYPDWIAASFNLTNSTNLKVTRESSTGTLTYAYYVVEFPGDVSVQKGAVTMGSGTLSANATISTVNGSATAVILSGNQYIGTTNFGTDDNYGHAAATVELLDNTTIRINRTASTSTSKFIYYVVDFNPFRPSVVTNVPADQQYVLENDTATDVSVTAQSGTQAVLIKSATTGNYSALLNLDFSSDIDVSMVSVNSSRDTTLSFIHNSSEIPGFVNKSLLIPRVAGTGVVYICPSATKYSEVNSSCSGRKTLRVGDKTAGYSVSTATYDGESYYVVAGVVGTGGGEGDAPTHTTPVLNATDNPLNRTDANLTAYNQTTKDNESDAVYNVYDWRLGAHSAAVLNMPFNRNVTSTAADKEPDFSTFGNNGTLGAGSSAQAPEWTSKGIYGGAYNFTKANQDVIVIDESDTMEPQNGTFMFWIRPGGSPGVIEYLAVEDKPGTLAGEWDIWRAADNTISFRRHDGSFGNTISSDVATSANNWHHIAAIGETDGGWQMMYINGTKQTDNLSGWNIGWGFGDNPLTIGGYNSTRTDQFNGLMDQVKFFNRSLSGEQIRAIYDRERLGVDSSTWVADETASGEQWSACVTPTDGRSDGTTLCSNSLTVQSFSPTTVSRLSPPGSLSVVQNDSFNYSANVSCPSGDCGDVAVSLRSIPDGNATIQELSPFRFWMLDGDGLDSSGNGGDPDLTYGSPIAVTSQLHNPAGLQMMQFTGDDSYQYPDNESMNTCGATCDTYAMSVWFNATTITDTGNGQTIWSQGGATNSISMYVSDDSGEDRVYCTAVEGANIDYASWPVQEGELYHLTCLYSFSSNVLYLYLDGDFKDGEVGLEIGSTISEHTGDMALGGQDSDTDDHNGAALSGNFTGYLGEFAYWGVDDTLPTAQDIEDIYQTGIARLERGKLVSTTNGETPFESLVSNPQTSVQAPCLGGMTAGESCPVNWTVNVSGLIGSTHRIFASTSSSTYSEDIDVTIAQSTGVVTNVPAGQQWVLASDTAVDVSSVQQSGNKDVLIKSTDTGNYSALVTLNFNGNVDVSAFSADANRDLASSYVHNSSTVSSMSSKRLLIPRVSNSDAVFVCPSADNKFSEVNASCTGRVDLKVGDPTAGYSVSTTSYDGESYYLVSGLTGSGGAENDVPTQTTPTLLATDNPLNRSSANLVARNQTTKDNESDTVHNNFDWRLNGESIALLNLDFDINISDNNTNIRDHTSFNQSVHISHAGSGNHPTWNSGGVGNGYYSSDGNDMIVVDQNESLQNFFLDGGTISLWMNISAFESGLIGGVISVDDGFLVSVVNSGGTKLRFSHNYNTTSGIWQGVYSSYINDWVHVALTFNSSSTQDPMVYVNNVALTMAEFQTPVGDATGYNYGNISLLEWEGWGSTGYMDQVMIFNRSLSAEQIAQIYDEQNRSRFGGQVNSSTLLSQETSQGDTWTACVTPSDSFSYGSQTCSAPLTINSAPTHDNPVLNMTDHPLNRSDANLTAWPQNGNDADGDPITWIYDFRKDGVSNILFQMPFDKNISDEASGAVRDYSSSARNGTLGDGVSANVPAWNASGIVGGSYHFDGTNDLITVPDSSVWNDAFGPGRSISLWFNAESLGESNEGRLISHWDGSDGWFIALSENYLGTTGRGLYLYRDYSALGRQRICPSGDDGFGFNEWTHLVVVDETVYINGNSSFDCTSIAPSGSVTANAAGPLVIGNYDAGTRTFDGRIDEVRLFDHELTAEEVQQLYRHEYNVTDEFRIGSGQNWSVYVTPTDGIEDGTTKSDWLVTTNGAALASSVTTVSAINFDQSLNCSVTVRDDDAGDTANASVQWYKDGVADYTQDYNNDYSDGDSFVAVLGPSNMTAGESWTCQVTLDDGEGFGPGLNSSATYVTNYTDFVTSQLLITEGFNNFSEVLDDFAFFGSSATDLGDLNGDGVVDVAIGAPSQEVGGTDHGSVFILFLQPNGSVKKYVEITEGQSNFSGTLDSNDEFGQGLDNIGDLNGDGVIDLAVGAYRDDDEDGDSGAVYILFLHENGTVKKDQKISDTAGGFTGTLDVSDWWGRGVTHVGDVDDDGTQDIAVGAYQDDDGGLNRGAVYVLFLNDDGTVKDHQKISDTQGNLTASLPDNVNFGYGLAGPGDINGDGIPDIAVGQVWDSPATVSQVHILYLNRTGTVKGELQIGNGTGGLPAIIDAYDAFGMDISAMDDLDGDGNDELLVGARLDDGIAPGSNSGAMYLLYLNDTGGVKDFNKLSRADGGISIDPEEDFGISVTPVGDIDGDGFHDFVVGARYDQEAGSYRGSAFVLFSNISAGNSAPTHDTPILNATDHPLNRSDANLTAWPQNGNDADGDPISWIYDFRKDGVSNAFFNMPFDTNVSSTTAGAVSDYSTNEHDGTLGDGASVPSPTWIAAGSVGGAYDFDGTDDVITVPDDPEFDKLLDYDHNYSFSLWFYADTFGESSEGMLLSARSGGSGWEIGLEDRFGDNVIRIYRERTGTDSIRWCPLAQDGYSLDTWVHFVYADGSLYFDGEEYTGSCEGTISSGSYVYDAGVDLHIGNNPSGSRTFNGYIDQVQFFDYTLTQEEVENLYEKNYNQTVSRSLADGQSWTVAVTPTDSMLDGTTKVSDALTLSNGAPNPSTVSLPGSVNASFAVDCSITLSDDDGDSLNVTVGWYKDGVLDTTQTFDDTYADGDSFTASLGSSNTTGGESWTCAVTAFDGEFNSSQVNATTIIRSFPTFITGTQKISETAGNFSATLGSQSYLGTSIAEIGDLNGDGIEDIAVGAPGTDDGGSGRGSVIIMFLHSNGTVKKEQNISDTEGNFSATLDDSDSFGEAVENIGDLNGDGIVDIAVGAEGDDDGASATGAFYVLFLHSNGTVKKHQKVSATAGNFTETVDSLDRFGSAIGSLGDLNGDGTDDLAVGSYRDDDGGTDHGAVYVLFMNPNGTVKKSQKISDTAGNFSVALQRNSWFGIGVAGMGDVNGDGVVDMAVGASEDYGSIDGTGSVYMLFLNSNGTVKNHQQISSYSGGFPVYLNDNDEFGIDVASMEDTDGNGIKELLIGSWLDDDGATSTGSAYYAFINSSGMVSDAYKVSEWEGGITGLESGDLFGEGVSAIGDVNDDGNVDFAVAGSFGDDGGTNSGAFYILFSNISLGNNAPTHDTPILNTTDHPINSSNANLTAWPQNGNDADGDPITWIYDFRVNGSSYAFLNMPFDTNITSTAVDKVGDYSTNLHNGTLGDGVSANTPLWRGNGSTGGAFDFDGSNDVITVDDDPEFANMFHLGDTYSVSLWFNAESMGEEEGFYGQDGVLLSHRAGGHGWQFSLSDTYGDRAFGLYREYSGQDAVFTCPWNEGDIYGFGEWVHVVYAGDANIYVNGVLQSSTCSGTTPSGSPQPDAATDLRIGSASGGAQTFDGYIDQVMFFNYTLSQDEVLNLYNKSYDKVLSSRLGAGQNWTVAVTPTDGKEDGTTRISNDVILSNGAPNAPTLSAPTHLNVTKNINCSITVTDDDGDTLNVSVQWYKDGVADYSEQYNNDYASGSTFVAALGAGNTSGGQTWICQARSDDSVLQSAFVNSSGTYVTAFPTIVLAQQNISEAAGNFSESLETYTYFGISSTALGDLNGDGIADIAVGAPQTHDGGTDRGSVYILFLHQNGTVKKYQEISDTQGNFSATFTDDDNFGAAVTNIGDLNGDGTIDLAVGVENDDGGQVNEGAVQILFLQSNGTVKRSQRIAENEGNLSQSLGLSDGFGNAIGRIGDVNGDGTEDLLVGMEDYDQGTSIYNGTAYLLFMQPNGTVKRSLKMTTPEANFSGVVQGNDQFGASATGIGDVNGDGIADVVVGATQGLRDEGGRIFVLFLHQNGTVKKYQEISNGTGGLSSFLEADDYFGSSLARVNDTDGDGIDELLVGAWGDADGSDDTGATYLLYLNASGQVTDANKISAWEGGPTDLQSLGAFGASAASIGDLDADGGLEFGIGAYSNDVGGLNNGAMHIFFTNISAGGGVVTNVPAGQQWVLASDTSVDVSSSQQYGTQPVLIKSTTTGNYSALIYLDFSSDVDVSAFSADASRDTTKSFVHNSSTVVAMVNKSLLIPRVSNSDAVFVCPSADNKFSEVNGSCTGRVNLKVGSPTAGYAVSTTTYDTESYYLVTGLTGSGGAENDAPTHTTPVLNATDNPDNTTNANLTAYNQTTKDNESDTVSNTYDWRLNGTSIAMLNLPFDTNVSTNAKRAVRDVSSYGHNVTLKETGAGSDVATWSASGVVGGRYDFNGVDQYINIRDDMPTRRGTIVHWLRPASVKDAKDPMGVYQASCSNGACNGWGAGASDVLEMHTGILNSVYAFQYQDGANTGRRVYANFTAVADQWVHMAVTWDQNGSIRIYINGSQNATEDITNTSFSGITSIVNRSFGRDGDPHPDRFWNGSVDEIKVYNRTLSPEQILRIFTDEKDGFSDNSTLVSDETAVGDTWSVCVTPSDSTTDGSTLCSANLTIETAPNGGACSFDTDCVSNYCVDSVYEGSVTTQICCAANSCVDSGGSCVVDGATSGSNTCYQGVWIDGNGRFEVRNVSDSLVMTVDKWGSMAVRGAVTEACTTDPTASGAWIVNNVSGTNATWVDRTGDMCVLDDITNRSAGSACTSVNCYQVDNASGTPKARFFMNGSVFLQGDYAQNVGTLS